MQQEESIIRGVTLQTIGFKLIVYWKHIILSIALLETMVVWQVLDEMLDCLNTNLGYQTCQILHKVCFN